MKKSCTILYTTDASKPIKIMGAEQLTKNELIKMSKEISDLFKTLERKL